MVDIKRPTIERISDARKNASSPALSAFVSFLAGIAVGAIVVYSILFLVVLSMFSRPAPDSLFQPAELMHDNLKDTVQKGYGSSTPRAAILRTGTVIYSKQVIDNDLPGVNSTEVQFLIDAEISADDLPRTTTSIGPAKSELRVFIVVCGDASQGEQGKYRVAIAKSSTAASDTCVIPTN